MKDNSHISNHTKQEFGIPKLYSKRKGVAIFKVDPELWSRFKEDCASRGVSICYVLETLMEGWLQAQKVNATIIQPVNMTINMQHVVQRPRRLGPPMGPEYTTSVGCQGLEHRDWGMGKLGWCHKIKRWISLEDCGSCRQNPQFLH